MSMEQVLDEIRSFDGVLELSPGAGSGFPEIAWGDHFFYYSPDGTIQPNTQPYATIVTKDYPDDTLSNLDPADRWRLNIHVGSATFTSLTGESPRDFAARGFASRDFSTVDEIMPHPVYGALGWIAVVNPGERTTSTALTLLREAHDDERRRAERRASVRDGNAE